MLQSSDGNCLTLGRPRSLGRPSATWRMSVSSFWQYFSFRQERWDAIFGGGLPGAERHVVASAVWDDMPAWDNEGNEFPDPSDDLDAYLDAVYRQASEHVVG